MSALAALLQAHRLMTRIVDRLERSSRLDRRAARMERRGAILVLLRALERHEALEDMIFAPDANASQERAEAAAAIETQHRRLEGLREELVLVLSARQGPDLEAEDRMIARLVRLLRSHFQTEERRLWPLYSSQGRSLDRLLEHSAQAQVRELKREIDRLWLAYESV